MSGRKAREAMDIAVCTFAQTGQRGILLTGWAGLSELALPANIFPIDTVPHDWLFPQVAAVVHHGGAGTTAAGLRAGRPTITVPFFGDQPFWARQVYKLGVGPAPIPSAQLAVKPLAAAIHMTRVSAHGRPHWGHTFGWRMGWRWRSEFFPTISLREIGSQL